ncbi:hypothetical protein GCM10020331_069590 [Ectobacillus funiculus]
MNVWNYQCMLFQYELAAEEMTEVRSRFKPEETWGVFIQNRLAAQLTLIPLQIYLHGKKTFSMGGIASVSTWPEFRRQGLVAHLLTHAMELMKENGQTISFLTPFAFDFFTANTAGKHILIIKDMK